MNTKFTKFGFVLISTALLSGAIMGCAGGGDDNKSNIKEVVLLNQKVETYKEGDSVKKSDVTIQIVYKDGSTETIKSSQLSVPSEPLSAGDTSFVVTYVDEFEKEWKITVPITVNALTGVLVSGFPTDSEQPGSATYETIFANVEVTGQWGELTEKVTKYTIYDNGAEVADKKALLADGNHEVKVGIGSIQSTTSYVFAVVGIKDLSVDADLNSIYLDSTTWQDIRNALTVKAVYSETKSELYDDFELYEGDALIADYEEPIAAGSHTFKVKLPGLDKEKSFTINVQPQASALVVEAETITTSAPTDPSVKGYTMAKTSPSGDYVAISDSNTQPWCRETTRSASGGANVGSTAADYVMEWHFYAEANGKAVPQLRAASCWLKEDNGSWDPRWMGDIVLAELFTAQVNGKDFEIPSNKVLKGSGFKGNQNAGVATWYSWNTAEFGEIDVQQGWNVFTMHFKTTAELQQLPVDADTGRTKYVNCHDSYTLMNIDCMNIFFIA